MTELLTEHWWQISLAIAAAIVLAVLHRVCANIAFDTSYRKGFFTQGTLFGIFLGFPGILFVNTWRQMESPNSANQQQLEMAAGDGEERWGSSLSQIALGLAILYYQLVATVLFGNTEIGSAWFWLAALALLVTGWYRYRGAHPAFQMMPPLENEEFDDPPELIEMATRRHEWGRLHERRLITNRLAITGIYAACSAAAALVCTWYIPLPVNHWIATLACLVAGVAGLLGWHFMRRRTEGLTGECDRLLLVSVPDGKQRELLELKIALSADIHRMGAFLRLRLTYILSLAGSMCAFVALGIFLGRPAFYCLAGLMLAGLIVAAAYLKRLMEEIEAIAVGLEDRDIRISDLDRQVETETIEQARLDARQNIDEVYSFQMGDLRGMQRHPPEKLSQWEQEDNLNERDRTEAMAEREQMQLHWQALEMEFAEWLARSRKVSFWTGCAILLLMGVLDWLQFNDDILPAIKYTGLGCLVYALATYLPERFAALRNHKGWGKLANLLGIAVVIVLIAALSSGWPA